MLTGDKLETATSIGRSSKLISKTQTLFTFKQVSQFSAWSCDDMNPLPLCQVGSRSEAHTELNNWRKKNDCALIIAGDSLEVCTVLCRETYNYRRSTYFRECAYAPSLYCADRNSWPLYLHNMHSALLD